MPDYTGDSPNLDYLMVSVIRLMAMCAENACPQQARTLVHLLDYLLKHPQLERTPGAAAAVAHAAGIWRARLERTMTPDGRRVH